MGDLESLIAEEDVKTCAVAELRVGSREAQRACGKRGSRKSESQIRVRGKRICAKFGSRPIPLGTWSPRVQSLMIEAAKTFLSVAGW